MLRGARQANILELSRKLGIPTPAEGEAADEFFYGHETVGIPPHCPQHVFVVVLGGGGGAAECSCARDCLATPCSCLSRACCTRAIE